MNTILPAVVSALSFRFRRRTSLELELVALRHQVAVPRRQRPGRLRLFSTDRLLWMWLYRIWPRALNAMTDIVAVDMFVVATATFRLFYALIVLGHDRRSIFHFDVAQNPTQAWLSLQMTEAFLGRRRRAICCRTVTHRMVRTSAIEFTRWASKKSLPRRGRPGRTR